MAQKFAEAYVQISHRGVRNVDRAFRGLHRSMARYLGVAGVGGLLVTTAKTFMSFEKEMMQVNTLLRLGKEDFQALTKEVLGLAWQMGVAPASLANAFYQVTSATFRGAKAIDILKVAHKGAIAGAAQLHTVTKLLVGSLNAYGESGEAAERYMAAFFKAVDRGLVVMPEMVQHFGMVTKIAAQVGMSIEELSALMAILTRNNIQAAQAVTGLRAMLMQLLKPQEKALKLANELGISFDLDTIKTMGWSKWLGILQERTGGNEKILATMFGRMRGISSVLAVAGKNTETLADEMKHMNTAIQDFNKAAGIMEEGTARKWEILMARMKVASIDFFNSWEKGLKEHPLTRGMFPEKAKAPGMDLGARYARAEKRATDALKDYQRIQRTRPPVTGLTFGGYYPRRDWYRDLEKASLEYRRATKAFQALQREAARQPMLRKGFEFMGVQAQPGLAGFQKYGPGGLPQWSQLYGVWQEISNKLDEIKTNTKETASNTEEGD